MECAFRSRTMIYTKIHRYRCLILKLFWHDNLRRCVFIFFKMHWKALRVGCKLLCAPWSNGWEEYPNNLVNYNTLQFTFASVSPEKCKEITLPPYNLWLESLGNLYTRKGLWRKKSKKQTFNFHLLMILFLISR